MKFVEEENRCFREFIGKLSDELFLEVWGLYLFLIFYSVRFMEKGIIVVFKERDR